MDAIFTTLVNQIAPLLVQLLGALVLALASAILLKAAPIITTLRGQKELAFVDALSKVFVHTAEVQGIASTGAQKAAMARALVDSTLQSHGVKTTSGIDIQNTIAASVEAAWAFEIGPTRQEVGALAVLPVGTEPLAKTPTNADGTYLGPTEPPAGSPTGIPNADGTYPVVPNLPVEPPANLTRKTS